MHINIFSVNFFSFLSLLLLLFSFPISRFEGKYKIWGRYLGEPIFQNVDESRDDPSLNSPQSLFRH